MKTLTRRALGSVMATTMAMLGLVITQAPAHAAFTSTVGGTITRSEVIERAQYWVDHQPGPYDQTAYSPDPTGSRNYRRDCSGFVDMAWHTSTDNWTGNMSDISYSIDRSDLKPGDILNSAADHVILFDQWEADHVYFSYYSFGSTPVKHKTHISINAATFDSHPNGDYVARRYNKIVDGAGGGSSLHEVYADTSGWHDGSVGSQVQAMSAVSIPGSSHAQTMTLENGVLHEVYADASGWHDASTGVTLTAGASISSVYLNGQWAQTMAVDNGVLYQIYGDASGWHKVSTGVTLQAGASISAVYMGAQWPQVMAVDSGVLYQIYGDASGWHKASTGIAASRVSAVNKGGTWPTSMTIVNGVLHEVYADTSGWHDASTGITLPSSASFSAVYMNGLWPQTMAVDGGVLYQIYGDTSGWHKVSTGVPATSVSAINTGGQWPLAMTTV
ncbi:MAG TPA: hypothetical protein VL738_40445 [Dactylosporangium sp.]|nr:hypothetical protein [Dactylosporangium sp.]